MKEYRSLNQTRTNVANATNHTTKLTKHLQSGGNILAKLLEFALSVPDFRRQCKGNYCHKLSDVIILMIFARASKCVSRAEIIAYGKHNLKKFQKMGMFMNGIPSEPTIWRIEYGINELVMADKMCVFAELFNQKLLEKYCGMEIICID